MLSLLFHLLLVQKDFQIAEEANTCFIFLSKRTSFNALSRIRPGWELWSLNLGSLRECANAYRNSNPVTSGIGQKYFNWPWKYLDLFYKRKQFWTTIFLSCLIKTTLIDKQPTVTLTQLTKRTALIHILSTSAQKGEKAGWCWWVMCGGEEVRRKEIGCWTECLDLHCIVSSPI